MYYSFDDEQYQTLWPKVRPYITTLLTEGVDYTTDYLLSRECQQLCEDGTLHEVYQVEDDDDGFLCSGCFYVGDFGVKAISPLGETILAMLLAGYNL